MSRTLPTDFNNKIQEEFISWALLLELEFDDDTVNVWTGVGDLSFDGKTWQGVGTLGSISGALERIDQQDDRIVATLSGIPDETMPDLVGEVTDGDPVGRPYTLTMAMIEEGPVVSSSITISAGQMDAVDIIDGAASSISIQLVSEAAVLKRRTFYRMSDQAQQSLFADDVGLAFVTDLDDNVRWGSAGPQQIASPPSAGRLPEVPRDTF